MVVGVATANFRSVVVGDAPDIFAPMMMKAQITPGWNDLDRAAFEVVEHCGAVEAGRLGQAGRSGDESALVFAARDGTAARCTIRAQRLRTEFMKTHLSLSDGAKGLSPMRNDFSKPLMA